MKRLVNEYGFGPRALAEHLYKEGVVAMWVRVKPVAPNVPWYATPFFGLEADYVTYMRRDTLQQVFATLPEN